MNNNSDGRGEARLPLMELPPATPDSCCANRETAEQPAGCDRTVSVATGQPGWLQAARQARMLSWFSLIWMTAEGVLGLVAGTRAGSIALIGWALASIIEGAASIIVIWRFTGTRTLSETAEARAHRAVAISFFALAPYIAIEAVYSLATGHESTTTVVGVVVTALSVVIMPGLGLVKRRLGRRLGSGATAGEGTQNLLCAAQGAGVLIGLLVTAAVGWSWLDPVIALGLAAVAVREGREAWRGEDCC